MNRFYQVLKFTAFYVVINLRLRFLRAVWVIVTFLVINTCFEQIPCNVLQA